MSHLQLESKICCCNITENTKINNVLIAIFGSLAIAVATQIAIPLHPVPITLQTFAALLVGMVLGPKQGSAAVSLYLFEGICGLPVFSNFSYGPAVIFGPTGGYLIGFVFAALIAGCLLQRGWAKRSTTTFLAALLGDIALFACGYLMLSYLVGFHKAYLCGVAPFYLVEAIKLAILTAIVPYCWQIKTKNDAIGL